MVVLHGIYGRGANWRSFARKLCERMPSWGLLLTDLRMHGQSLSAPPPHHLQACAEDVLALVDQQAQAGRVVAAVLGHSFGGKVALEMRRIRPSTPVLWVVDSSPSSQPGAMDDKDNTVVAVLGMLRALPDWFSSREAFVSAVQGQGFERSLALWLAMNLEREEQGYRNALQPAAIGALLSSYFDRDLWPVVEAGGNPIHVVRASRGSALTDSDERRLQALSRQGPVWVHSVQGGHWLHVDALDALVRLVADGLS